MYPTKSKVIHLSYGVRGTWWAAGYHTGTDFDADVGTAIYATKGGTVEFVGLYNGWGQAYGTHIVIRSEHEGRTVKHMYAHLSYTHVRAGAQVKAGEFIGKSGNTGNTSGPHLHYEERKSPFGYWDSQRPVLLGYEPAEPKPVISVSKVQPGKTNLHVAKLKRRMNKYFPKKKPIWGPFFTKELRARYTEYQKNLGYKGTEANGRPGRTSLEKLGFRVTK